MKKLILLLTVFTSLSASAGVITCSNNVNSPGQYTLLQDAIDNANANDTILVHGSSTSYGSIVIDSKKLSFFGNGYKNPNGLNSTIAGISLKRATATLSSSGTSFSGFAIGTATLDASPLTGTVKTLSNITFERCEFVSHGTSTSTANIIFFENYATTNYLYSNILIKNCLFNSGYRPFSCTTSGGGWYTHYMPCSNVVFENNIFSYSNIRLPGSPDLSGLIFRNNIFLDTYSSLITYEGSTTEIITGPLFENNIINGGEGISGCRNCTFNNNITSECVQDSLVYSGNINSTGGGNIIGQDPLFVDVPLGIYSFSYANDYNLQPASPSIGSGSSGTDMGIYGGTAPFEVGANPAIPQMQETTTPLGSTVSQGTNLNVTFKSYKQD